MLRHIKFIAILTVLLVSLAGSAMARQRLFTFSNNNDSAVKEVNYYLDRGAKVLFMDTAAKVSNSTVIITVVLDIPDEIADYR